ncbi:MAG TPA: 16S rRNA (adenine(1518)-N(6)/adenine(1519)-N(6))-dimethyltransferase RsmA [Gemmatimonadales bacterium]|nr:16S rRNA (adenine(1518)-N(6)/adenine(1519)-N(6))-dimethyltransferase RsmA [Gemmatimonadales bacterium]
MKPKKSLGQHFLSDVGILGRIADALDLSPGETVLEIGPGRGDLTRQLLARGARVVAVEKDERLAAALTGNVTRETGNVRVVEGDALEIDWHPLVRDTFPVSRFPFPDSRFPFPGFSVIGNIPYYITSPLLEKALTPPLPSRIVFLVQKEVADRIVAPPGSRTYGALSVGIQAVCTVEKLFVVKAGAFRPPPKVDSAVIRLTPLEQPLVPVEQGTAFRRFVVAAFGQRRKQLRNVLARVTGRPAAAVADEIRALGFDPQSRPETLSPADFARLLIWSRQL